MWACGSKQKRKKEWQLWEMTVFSLPCYWFEQQDSEVLLEFTAPHTKHPCFTIVVVYGKPGTPFQLSVFIFHICFLPLYLCPADLTWFLIISDVPDFVYKPCTCWKVYSYLILYPTSSANHKGETHSCKTLQHIVVGSETPWRETAVPSLRDKTWAVRERKSWGRQQREPNLAELDSASRTASELLL